MSARYDVAVTEQTTTTTSLVCSMPVHASGDLLCVFATKDGSAIINNPGGIYTSRLNGATAGSYTRVLTGVATGSSETLTLTTGTTDSWQVVIVAVRNPHGTPFDFCSRVGADDSTNPYAGLSGQSTANDNTVVFHFFGGDGGHGAVCQSPAVNISNGDAGAGSTSVAYVFQPIAGSIPALDWYTGVNDDARPGILAIRLADATDIPPYAHPSQTVGEYLRPLSGALTGPFSDTWDTASPLSETALGGVNITFDGMGNVADNGVNPYMSTASITPDASSTNLGGNELTFGAALDMDTGILVGTYRGAQTRDLAIDQGLGSANMGTFLALRSSAGNYDAWRVSAKFDSTTDPDGRNTYAIGLNDGAVTTLTAGTLNNSAVTSMFLLCRNPFGVFSCQFSTLALVSNIGIHGGASGRPLDFNDIALVVNSSVGLHRLFAQSGSAATLYAPIRFGGSAKTVIDVNLRTFQFPTQYDGVSFMDWNVDTNVAGVEFYGVDSNDSFVVRNCVFTGDSPYRFAFNASHSASTPLNFSGTTVVGATVTLRATSDLDNMSFINCPTFTQNGATLTDMVFDNTVVDASSPANAELISDSAFVSDGTGYGLVVTGTAADFDLDNVSFTGFAVSDGSTGNEAVYINIGSGSLTISILNGGTIPSIRTAGAVVTVVSNPVTTQYTVTDTSQTAISGARVLLETSNGTGPLPFAEAVTITQAAGTATVAHVGHGIPTGTNVVIRGATQNGYNKVGVITVTGVDAYTYAVDSGTVSPATGSPVASGVIISGTTNGSGVISDTRAFGSNQPFKGTIRSSSGSPYYQPATVTGTISSTGGFSANIALLSDE